MLWPQVSRFPAQAVTIRLVRGKGEVLASFFKGGSQKLTTQMAADAVLLASGGLGAGQERGKPGSCVSPRTCMAQY